MKSNLFFRFVLVVICCMAFEAKGTVLKPLDLDELIKNSDFVADVNVSRLESFSTDPIVHTRIKTRVYFTVNRVVKGPIPTTFHLDFPGGTVGQITRVVEGIPSFQIGQRLIIFGRNDPHAFSPLVGMEQGALQIIHDDESNVDRVYRWWGQPVNASESFLEKKPVPVGTSREYLRSADAVQAFIGRIEAKVKQGQWNQ